MNDAEQINMEVLRQWITGRGKHPVTWTTLTQVLHDIELSTLAREIEAIKCHEDTKGNNSTDKSVNIGQTDMPTGSSNQSNTGDLLSRCTKGVTHCETLEQAFIYNLLATNLLGVDDPPDERVQRDTTVKITEGLNEKNIGDVPLSDAEIEDDSDFEAIQVGDIVCRGTQQSKENRRSNVFSADIEDPPVERVQKDESPEIIEDSEQRSIAGVHSSDIENASLNKEENNQRSSIFHEDSEDPPVERVQRHIHITAEYSHQRNSEDIPASSIYSDKDYEHIQQIADIVCKCVQQLKEKEKSQCSVHPGNSEQPPVERELRNIPAEVNKGPEQQKIRDPDASCIADDEYYEAVQQIAAIAAGLPSRCSELLESLDQEKKSGALHKRGIGSVAASGIKEVKSYAALQHIAHIAAELFSRCFALLEYQTSYQENEQNPTTSAPHEIGDRQQNITLTQDEVLD